MIVSQQQEQPTADAAAPAIKAASLGPSNVAVILLAGGKGKRMKSAVPKQFLPLLGKPVFLRSLDIFRSMTGIVSNIIIVLDESYREEIGRASCRERVLASV